MTGATGFIGGVLLGQLAEAGYEVHALYRSGSEHKTNPSYPSVHYIEGDILDLKSLRTAMAGCTYVYHMAAYARVWAASRSTFFDINVEGTQNVLSTAYRLGIKKAVVTSTAATLPPSNAHPVNELAEKKIFHTTYEQTKLLSEEVARRFNHKGLPTVIVNPPRVFGPGRFSESNAMTKIIKWYVQGTWRFLPGDGSYIGNYAYVNDVARGHRQAMEYGTPGQRYILGGTNASFKKFFDHLAAASGINKTLIPVPVPLIKSLAHVESLKAGLFRTPPLLTPEWVDKYFQNWELSSDKARKELNYEITPVDQALSETVEWIKQSGRPDTQPRAKKSE